MYYIIAVHVYFFNCSVLFCLSVCQYTCVHMYVEDYGMLSLVNDNKQPKVALFHMRGEPLFARSYQLFHTLYRQGSKASLCTQRMEKSWSCGAGHFYFLSQTCSCLQIWRFMYHIPFMYPKTCQCQKLRSPTPLERYLVGCIWNYQYS